jgi:putative phosphoesterase
MRIAALYDIHGNLPALEAVLADVHESAVDLIVVGGDIMPGPMPREVLHVLLSLETPVEFIMGNGDREVLSARSGSVSTAVPEAFREVMHWCAAELDQADAIRVAGWPATVTLEVAGIGRVLFCHATPRSDTVIFTRLTPDDAVAALLESPDDEHADLIVCGHTHMQFDRRVGESRVVNAGSVGMPFGDPGACWLLLNPGVELRRTAYDLERAAERIRDTRYPQGNAFAAQNVLQPPREEDMLKLFTK